MCQPWVHQRAFPVFLCAHCISPADTAPAAHYTPATLEPGHIWTACVERTELSDLLLIQGLEQTQPYSITLVMMHTFCPTLSANTKPFSQGHCKMWHQKLKISRCINSFITVLMLSILQSVQLKAGLEFKCSYRTLVWIQVLHAGLQTQSRKCRTTKTH